MARRRPRSLGKQVSAPERDLIVTGRMTEAEIRQRVREAAADARRGMLVDVIPAPLAQAIERERREQRARGQATERT